MHQTRLRLAIVATAIGLMLAGAGVALASNSTPPRLSSPANGGTQKSGRVTLVAFDPGLTGNLATPIFLIVSDRRSLDRRGHLTVSRHCGSRCDFQEMKRWKGHPGYWIYRAPYRFPGYWGVTPGRYFWQVYHFVPGCRPSCVEYSAIRRFRVSG
jgi:hypothetical protein